MLGVGGPARRASRVAALVIAASIVVPGIAAYAAPDDDGTTTTTTTFDAPSTTTVVEQPDVPDSVASSTTTTSTTIASNTIEAADEPIMVAAAPAELAAAPEAAAAAAPAPVACAVASTIYPGYGHGGAVCLEARLAELGYAVDGPDNYFAGASVSSLQSFQQTYGIPGNGLATPLTLAHLGIWGGPSLWTPCGVDSTIYPGYGHGLAPCLEARLAQMGYNIEGPDTYFAGASVSSLQSFQQTYGIPGNGLATPLTLAHLGIWSGPSLWTSCGVDSTIYPGYGHGLAPCLEARLAQMGYNIEGPDTYFAGASVSSLQAFQQAHGLPGNGLATPLTLAYLSIWTGPSLWTSCGVDSTIYPGYGHGLAPCLEAKLARMGYNIEGPDVYFAGASVTSLIAFQRSQGLAPDGVAGPFTLLRLGIWTGPNPDPNPLPDNSGSGRRVVYSRAQQRVWAVDDNGTVIKTHRVSGRTYEPYAGTYSVYSRSMYTYSQANPAIKWRYMVRFAYGPGGGRIGFHEIPNRNGVPLQTEAQLGQPLSGGCVRQSTPDAEWMWNWAGIGTKVVVL